LWREDQRRILDYFWNKRLGSHRKHVPVSIIYWLEAENAAADSSRTDFELRGLESGDNYVGAEKYLAPTMVDGTAGYELTGNGIAYVHGAHPLRNWEKMLERSSPVWTLVAAWVAFVASVFGIVQFILDPQQYLHQLVHIFIR
jgi:hypothetical protein